MISNTSNVAPEHVVYSRWMLEGILLPFVGLVGIIGKEIIGSKYTVSYIDVPLDL